MSRRQQESDYYKSKSGNRNSGSSSHRSRDRSISRSRSRSPQPPPVTAKRRDEKPTIQILGKNKIKAVGIQMKLEQKQSTLLQKPKLTVASAFNQDSDDEPEEMPPEAKMRMRNIGRDTPTSSGPNSFGKTKHGFSDAKKVFEKTLKEAMDSANTTK